MLGMLLGGIFVVFAVLGASSASPPPASPQAAELRAAMRRLWEDHIVYTRNLIISALAGLPDQPAVLQRLLRNQDEIGGAIRPFYGQTAAQELAALLRDHILIAVDVVRAAIAGDPSLVQAQQARWSTNARDIAAFLAAANPAWHRAELEGMLQKHLDLTTGEVVARLQQDWQADISSYDEGHAHMLALADLLADGIVEQQRSATSQGSARRGGNGGRGTYG